MNLNYKFKLYPSKAQEMEMLVGILAILILNLGSAQTTNVTATVNNTAPVIHKIFTYNSTGNTTLFDYQSNLTVRANITDANGRSDISSVLISFTDFSGNVIVNNASMNLTNISSGYTAEYNYSFNSSSTPGNYTLIIFVNDSAENNVTNSTVIKVQLIIQAEVSSPSSLQGHEMEIYHNKTLVQTSSTDSEGRIYVKKGYDWYTIYYHPYAGSSSWEYIETTSAYQTISITGSPGTGYVGGGGGGGIPYQEIEEKKKFILDLRFKEIWLDGNLINFLLTIKNVGNKSGDILLRYAVIQNNKIYNKKQEQVYINPFIKGKECSTLVCPYPAQIMLPSDISSDTYLKVEALELKENNITKVLASAEKMITRAKEKEKPILLIPLKPSKKSILPIVFLFILGIGGLFLIYKWLTNQL